MSIISVIPQSVVFYRCRSVSRYHMNTMTLGLTACIELHSDSMPSAGSFNVSVPAVALSLQKTFEIDALLSLHKTSEADALLSLQRTSAERS